MAKATTDQQEAKGIKITWLQIALTFIVEALGATNQNPDLMTEHVTPEDVAAAKAAQERRLLELQAMSDADRQKAMEEDAEKQMTVFYRFDGKPFYFDYVTKGFMKDTCRVMAKVPGSVSEQQSGFLKLIDGQAIHVVPRMIMFQLPEGYEFGKNKCMRPLRASTPESGIWPPQNAGRCVRPLRADTAQGPRVALACSETVPAGTKMEFFIRLQNPAHEKLIREWFAQGVVRGLGQWRNSGKGRFKAIVTRIEDEAAISKEADFQADGSFDNIG